MKNVFENSQVFNAGVPLLGLKVARVWSRSGWWRGFLLGLKEINPFKFGDLPSSWAWSFQAALQVAFGRQGDFQLRDNLSIVPGQFLILRDGQHGTVYFGRDVSFFVHYVYGEVDARSGASMPASIAFPSSLFLEFFRFIVGNDKRNIRKGTYNSMIFPGVAIATDVVRGYPEFRITPTLHEFKLCDDGIVEPISARECGRIILGKFLSPRR